MKHGQGIGWIGTKPQTWCEAMHEYEPKPNYNWRSHLAWSSEHPKIQTSKLPAR